MNTADAFDTLAHKLLDELDARHDELLAELDQLSARVDEVLSQYVQVRPDVPPPETNSDDDEMSDLDTDLDV